MHSIRTLRSLRKGSVHSTQWPCPNRRTHIQKQATLHDCLRWGHVNENNVLCGKKDFVLGWPRQDKSLFYRYYEPNEPRTPFICTLWVPPFTSVSTVSRGHPSLVSLVPTEGRPSQIWFLHNNVRNMSNCPFMHKWHLTSNLNAFCLRARNDSWRFCTFGLGQTSPLHTNSLKYFSILKAG